MFWPRSTGINSRVTASPSIIIHTSSVRGLHSSHLLTQLPPPCSTANRVSRRIGSKWRLDVAVRGERRRKTRGSTSLLRGSIRRKLLSPTRLNRPGVPCLAPALQNFNSEFELFIPFLSRFSSPSGNARMFITPYKSLKESKPKVPLVTDTVITQCRRCYAYINPYVQFIDRGNRYASHSITASNISKLCFFLPRWRCVMCSMFNETPKLFD